MPAAIVVTIEDGKGIKSDMLINIPTATTVANATTFINSLLALIDPLISGRIVRAGLCYAIALPGGLTGTANALSDVEEGAKFSFISTAPFKTGFRIPTFNETLLLSGTKQVDITDTDVDAFVDMIVAGNGTVAPVDGRDADITALNYAREQFVKDRG